MMGRRISEAEMKRRQQVANLRTDLSAFMAGHSERSIDIWQAALIGLLGRLAEWAIEEPESDDLAASPYAPPGG